MKLNVAIGAGSVTAIAGDSDRAEVIDRGVAGSRMSIADVFAEIARRTGAAVGATAKGAVVDVAIMPSLCEARLIQLPPMRQAEAEVVLRRDASRHFTVSNEQRVIAVRMPRRSASAAGLASAPVMAFAVSHALLDEIAAVAAHMGWMIRRIVPAQAAWLSAAGGSAARDSAGRARALVAIEDGTAHVVRMEGGTPAQLRRVVAAQHGSVLSAAGSDAGTVLLYGDEHERRDLSSPFASAGWSVLPSITAGAAAAKFAGTADVELVSDSHNVSRAARQRTLANRMAAAAVVLIIATAAVSYWGEKRELNAVRARRAAIRSQVGPLQAMRDSINSLEDRSRETQALFTSGARWSKTLYELTMLLPKDAHFTRLNATGDTITIEGEGARAGDALQAISRAPTLRNVHLDGPVQRELEAGSTATERFVITATLASAKPSAAPSRRRVNARPASSSTSGATGATGARQP